MGITTQLVQIILFAEIFVFLFLILPIPGKKNIIFSLKNSFLVRGLKHILLACYAMITLMFLDALFKRCQRPENLFFLYHAERNMYLTGFTLFLAIVYYNFQKMLIQIMEEEMSASVLKKQAHNQKDHVAKIMKENKENCEKIKELEDEKKKNEALVTQARNNQTEHLKLFEKYNDLVRKIGNENKKTV
ncbi:hypothetical protein COBT_001742 [Conglomerata obtusa]